MSRFMISLRSLNSMDQLESRLPMALSSQVTLSFYGNSSEPLERDTEVGYSDEAPSTDVTHYDRPRSTATPC